MEKVFIVEETVFNDNKVKCIIECVRIFENERDAKGFCKLMTTRTHLYTYTEHKICNKSYEEYL